MAWFRMMGAESVTYHRATVLERGDDHAGRALEYYGSRGETPLAWGGQLAERLGLAGPVDDAGYSAVFGPGGATDPVLGTRLARTTRPGVELVVAAHKSVAMLGLLGRVDDMHAILDAETDATMAFLDAWFARQGGRRGRDQTRTATGGLLWARTRHATSRAGDPAPHDHVLVANLTEMLDERGGWKALDTGGLRDLVHAATMAGRVASAAVAVERGYAITADAGPSGKLDHWTIAGIRPEVTALFSKRSADISAAVDAKGFDSPAARGIAARATRGPKGHGDVRSLAVRWLDELEGIGWPARKLRRHFDHVQGRLRRPLRSLEEWERAVLVGELVGPGGPLAERKVFTRSDVIRVAAPRLYGCAPEELDRVVAGVVAHREAIALVGQPGARGRAWVTASVLATESAVETVGGRLADHPSPVTAHPESVRAAIQAKEATLGRALTDGQCRAAVAVTTSGRGLDLVVGVAGSGKTTALEVARAAFQADGYRVLGTATSGQAARALQAGAGVESRTVASIVWRLEHQTLRLDARTVLFVDEAGMTDDADLLKLLAAAEEAGAKVVAIGDHHQLGAVGPGGALEALTRRLPETVTVLDENVRQHDPAERQALDALRSGRVADAVDWYQAKSRITIAPDRGRSLDEAAAAWAADTHAGHDTVLLAWRRRDVAALNHRARSHAIRAGRVNGPELEAPGGRCFAAGDRVVALAPSGDGRCLTSQRGTVHQVLGDDALTVVFDDGRTERLAGPELAADRLDHAYAVTVHRMQGATVDTAHLYADGGGRELAYVAMSRARQATHIYAVADTADQAATDLDVEWSQDARQRWTLDTDQPAEPHSRPHPNLAPRTSSALREVRLRLEHAAITAIAPWNTERLAQLDAQIRLERDAVPARPRQTPGLGLGR